MVVESQEQTVDNVSEDLSIEGCSGTPTSVDDSLWGGDEPLLWRWVGVGFLAMGGLHAAIVFGVLPLLSPSAMGIRVGLGVLPYLLGGLLLGFLPRQRSMLQPFYAAMPLAFLFSFIVEVGRVSVTTTGDMGRVMAQVKWVHVIAPIFVYVLVALAGAWLGQLLRRVRARGSDRTPSAH